MLRLSSSHLIIRSNCKRLSTSSLQLIAKMSTNIARLSVQGPIKTNLVGMKLLNSGLLNKGSAFTPEERKEFGLNGLLPPIYNTLDEQIKRAYAQFNALGTDLEKNQFCTSLRIQNKVLFFELVRRHIKEIFHIIYTPTVGDAIIQYSELFRKPEGCFLSITAPSEEEIEERLIPFGTDKDIDYIVVSDGEGVLGIGDQGVGGIGIVIGKLALMTACGGIHPGRGIPITLDVGTNNQDLINDPLYMGNRFPRVEGDEYNAFIKNFIAVVKRRFPSCVLHFEDFGKNNARYNLNTYRNELSCFNDDIQGTGAVVMSSITAALKVTKTELRDLKVVVFGAGSSGIGISQQIVNNMIAEGLTPEEAHNQIYVLNSKGLLVESTKSTLLDDQKVFCKRDEDWEDVNTKSLLEIVRAVKPHVLIGCSTRPKSFTKEIVQEMHKHVPRPIIFPLSNPTRLHEATPEELIEWTNGDVLVATGSPFAPVNGREISENNNCFSFPGIGLGSVLCRSSRISDKMIAASVTELASLSPYFDNENAGLLPDVSQIRFVASRVATAVILAAVEEGVATVPKEEIPQDFDECLKWVESQMWNSEYRPLVKTDEEHTYQL